MSNRTVHTEYNDKFFILGDKNKENDKTCLFIFFVCVLGYAIMLNFNMLKEAYSYNHSVWNTVAQVWKGEISHTDHSV